MLFSGFFKYFVPTFCRDTEVWFESWTSAGFECFHLSSDLQQLLTHHSDSSALYSHAVCVNPAQSVVTRTNHPAVWVMTQWNSSITYAVRGSCSKEKKGTLSKSRHPKTSQNPRCAPDVYLNSNKWSEHFGLFTSNPARLYLWCLGDFVQTVDSVWQVTK